jgi:hypothetical protein
MIKSSRDEMRIKQVVLDFPSVATSAEQTIAAIGTRGRVAGQQNPGVAMTGDQ